MKELTISEKAMSELAKPVRLRLIIEFHSEGRPSLRSTLISHIVGRIGIQIEENTIQPDPVHYGFMQCSGFYATWYFEHLDPAPIEVKRSDFEKEAKKESCWAKIKKYLHRS